MQATKELSLPEKIKIALDGRTQRWLCFSARIPEAELSRKMNGKIPFNQEEINKINDLLKTDFSAE